MECWSTFEPDSGMLINTPASLSFQSSPMAVFFLEVTNGALGFQIFSSQIVARAVGHSLIDIPALPSGAQKW